MKKYTKKTSDGVVYIDTPLFQCLKKEQTVICYNEEERRSHLLEFFCCICNRHSKGLKAGENHWTSQKHKKQLSSHDSKIKYVKNMRKLTPEEEMDLSKFLEECTEDKLMSEENFTERRNICRDVEETIKATGIYDVNCSLYGSSLTGICFKDANVNIDIRYDLEKIAYLKPHLADNALFLIHIYTTIKESEKFCDVKDLFHISVPKFTFTHVKTGLQCIVCPHFKSKVSWLIKDYIDIDQSKRVKLLCAAFRQWARICCVDDIDGGTLPPYCYTLMVLHYLQQVDPPVLPVINFHGFHYLPKDMKYTRNKNSITTEQVVKWTSTNTMPLGKLWVGLFRYYTVDFFFKTLVVNITQHLAMTKPLRGLNSRRISIEDPFLSKDNVASSLISSTVMEYFVSCLEKSYKHYSLCTEPDRGDKIITPDTAETSKKSERKKQKEEKRRSRSLENAKNQNKEKEKELSKAEVEVETGAERGVNEVEGTAPQVEEKEDSSDSDSENEDENSQNEDEHNVVTEYRGVHEDDTEDEADSDDDDEDEEEGRSRDGDDDNDSDVLIEEEYYEKDKKGGGDESEHLRSDDQDAPKEKNDAVNTPLLSASSEDIEPKDLQLNQHEGGSEIDLNQRGGKGYDSQYDADVESQDDSKYIHIQNEGHDTESSVFSDSCVDADNEDLQGDKSGDKSGEVPRSSVKLETVVDGNSACDDAIISTKSVGDDAIISTKSVGDDAIISTKSVDVSPNIEHLCIEDHGEETIVGTGNIESLCIEGHVDEDKVAIGNIETIVKSVLNGVVADVDSQQLDVNKEEDSGVNKEEDSGVNKEEDSGVNKEEDSGVNKEEDSGVNKEEDLGESCMELVAAESNATLVDIDSVTLETHDENTESNNLPEKDGEKLTFSFERKFIAPVRRVPLYCRVCNSDGHRSTECTSMSVGSVEPLKQSPGYFMLMLSKVCVKIFQDNELSKNEKQQRKKILENVERHLKRCLDPSVRLELFGSSVNNFGFQGSNRGRSDLDICMRFNPDELPDGMNTGSEIVKVSKALDKHQNFQNVMYIKSAKVPIVKFTIRDANLEGDISLYNCLALKNSTMLRDYSNIDIRVRYLGYCIKVFAKLCEIGDASRGSLSSYAYILLMLYYLQRCDPPVIPILQQLYDHSKKKPVSMIEGWDTWYFDDINQLANMWPGYQKNRQTVGELWLGFFRFYVEKFDFSRNVVAMRQLKNLSKFQKNWTRATMAIEDPFNLQHNLGGGISRNMFKYLLSCFKNARSHFGTMNNTLPQDATTEFLFTYFFDHDQLTRNKAVPKDRLCHRCGRIGHTASNCAEKIVADRERRRHDSEMTYSSENGDSDGGSSKKGRRNDIVCYGCQKPGHRVANCPEKLKNVTPNKRNSQSGGKSIIQASTDFHPQENIDIVLAKSEIPTRYDRTKRKGKDRFKLQTDIKNIETSDPNISPYSGRQANISHVNDLFNSPRKMPMEQANNGGFNFPNPNSNIGAAFLQSVANSSFPSSPSSHGSHESSISSPTKTPLKGSLLPTPNKDEEFSLFSSNTPSDFPQLPAGNSTSPSSSSWRSLPTQGKQPVSTTIQGAINWLPTSSEYTSVGQTSQLNRAIGTPVSRQPYPIQPLMDSPVSKPHSLMSPGYNNGGRNTPQRYNENASRMHQNSSGFQSFSFASSPPQRGPPRGQKQSPSNQKQATSPLFHSHSFPVATNLRNNNNMNNEKLSRSVSSPDGQTKTNTHWPQAPAPPPGYISINASNNQEDNSKKGFKFDNFVTQYNIANSPPKGGSPVKEFRAGGPFEESGAGSPMKYDEEYPPTAQRGGHSSSNKKGKKNSNRKGPR